MIINDILSDNELTLRNLSEKDCVQEYANWLNDKDVNQFLESHWHKETIETCKSFVTSINNSTNSILFGIFVNNTHIGNIKIGPIHNIYKHGDISYFIGNKQYWGQGYAFRAIKLILNFAFENLNLNRVNAGCCVLNTKSKKLLLKAGFVIEGCRRKERLIELDSEYYDSEYYGILKEEFEK